MNYERALMLAVIIGCFPPVSMKKECSNGHTYYSAIIKDCVACPSQSIGCTAMLNNETLDNCLDSCIPCKYNKPFYRIKVNFNRNLTYRYNETNMMTKQYHTFARFICLFVYSPDWHMIYIYN